MHLFKYAEATGASGWRYYLDLWMGWIRCRCNAHKKQVDVKQLYNRMPQTDWVSWSSRQAEFSSSCSHSSSFSRSWGQDGVVRASARQRVWALRTPVEQPSRMKKKCGYCKRNLGSICCSLFPSPTQLSFIININPFATPSRIKCERYIFLKKSVFVLHYCWLCFRV